MSIGTFLDAIMTDIQAPLAELRVGDIATSPGRFDASEIDRHSFKAPAVRIAFLGAGRSKAQANNARKFDASWGVFVVTDGRGREHEGLEIMAAVAVQIEGNRFAAGLPVGIPENIRLDPLYTSSVDDKGIALFSVSWTQTIRLGASFSFDGANDPTAIPPEGVDLTTQIDITDLPEGI